MMKQAQAENAEKYNKMTENYQHVIVPNLLS
jgi:hypothetical protein